MKMYRDEKTLGLHGMILFVEIFANIKCPNEGLNTKTFNIWQIFLLLKSSSEDIVFFISIHFLIYVCSYAIDMVTATPSYAIIY